MTLPLVSITVVTHNSDRFIGRCLNSVARLEYSKLDVIVVDNASQDGIGSILAGYKDRIRVIRNSHNIGFAAGQNQAIAASRGQWILTLNPDVLLQPGFVTSLVEAGELDTRAGSVCGKLLRMRSNMTIPRGMARIDSTGIYFTSSMRHFDRGWNEPDDGRFSEKEYVFGATAAAALYRREMVASISLDDEFFDPDFFAYREDADVAWRAQLLGWRCIYVPDAVGHHVRRVHNGARHGVPQVIRMHSVKNRFLMRIKNMTSDLYGRCWLTATARDLLVIAGCFVYEPSSLLAFWHLLHCLPRAVANRRQIMQRRICSDDYMAGWFRVRSLPLESPLPKQRHPSVVVSNAIHA